MVKYPPPKHVSVTPSDARCLLVGCKINSMEDLEWRLTLYQPLSRNSKVEEFPGEGHLNRTVCDLTPFTEYNVTLQVRPNYSDVWSDMATATGFTLMEVPDQPPELAPGYSVTGAEQAVFYWKAVPQEAAHGPGLHYNVSVNVASAQSCSPDGPQCSYSVETNATHAVVSLDDLDFSEGGVLQVTAVNKAGIGRDVAVLHLAPSVDVPFDVHAVIENETEDGMTLNVTWSSTSTRVGNYTFFWCTGHDPTNICKGDIYWEILPSTSTWYSQLIPRGRPGEVLFGVSFQTQANVISGFRFSACIFSRNNDGTLVPRTVGCDDKASKSEAERRSLYVFQSVFITITCLIFVMAVVIRCILAVCAKYRKKRRLFTPDLMADDETNDRKHMHMFQSRRRDMSLSCHLFNGAETEDVAGAGAGRSGGNSLALAVTTRISKESNSSGYGNQPDNSGTQDPPLPPRPPVPAPQPAPAGQCLLTPEVSATSLEDDQTTPSESDSEAEDLPFSRIMYRYVATPACGVEESTSVLGCRTSLFVTSQGVDEDLNESSTEASECSDEESYQPYSLVPNRYVSHFPCSASHRNSACSVVNGQESDRRALPQSRLDATDARHMLVTAEQNEPLTSLSFTASVDHDSEDTRTKVTLPEACGMVDAVLDSDNTRTKVTPSEDTTQTSNTCPEYLTVVRSNDISRSCR